MCDNCTRVCDFGPEFFFFLLMQVFLAFGSFPAKQKRAIITIVVGNIFLKASVMFLIHCQLKKLPMF